MDDTRPDWQERCRDFVRQHVFYCVSGLVNTLACNAHSGEGNRDLQDLCEEAYDLSTPKVTNETRKDWLVENNYRIVGLDDRWVITTDSDLEAYTAALEDVGYSLQQEEALWELVHEDDNGGTVTETKIVATFPFMIDELAATKAACAFLKLDPVYDEDAEGDDEDEVIEEFFSDGRHEDDLRDMVGEIYEHWIVSDYLAGRLEERGERIGKLDNLTVWGRGCTGQAILLDGVIQDIVKEYHCD